MKASVKKLPPIHQGEILREEFMLPRGLSQNALAQAMEAKRLTFAGATPPNELSASVRALEIELAAKAPAYLKPDAQTKLLRTAAVCLAVLELAVNWEAEKLYGVEDLGPFDEF